jgi:hypothetical protein
MTSLTVPPRAFLMPLASETGASAIDKRRVGPTETVKGPEADIMPPIRFARPAPVRPIVATASCGRLTARSAARPTAPSP